MEANDLYKKSALTTAQVIDEGFKTAVGSLPKELSTAIVKGENIPEPGIPESFKVLVKEMQSLCLNVEVLSSEGVAIEMRDTDEEVFRAAEELGINLSRVEPSSVEEV